MTKFILNIYQAQHNHKSFLFMFDILCPFLKKWMFSLHQLEINWIEITNWRRHIVCSVMIFLYKQRFKCKNISEALVVLRPYLIHNAICCPHVLRVRLACFNVYRFKWWITTDIKYFILNIHAICQKTCVCRPTVWIKHLFSSFSLKYLQPFFLTKWFSFY